GFRRLYSKGFQGVCLRLLEKKYWQQRASPTLDIIEPVYFAMSKVLGRPRPIPFFVLLWLAIE
ncbi:hypothetical protein, partial [Enterococcus avium]|uniref:hypothetical protein n=2 Tax=Enterococcus TaxID=1350 RepID=UPI002891016C